MGIDKRLVKLWKTRREDVITAYEVMAELGAVKKEDIAYLFKQLDRFAAADRKEKRNSV